MTNELARTYEVDGQEITLNPGTIMRYVLGRAENVSDPEMARAIMTCAARRLNPFAGDVHILPHWDSNSGTTKLSICPSIDFYQRRAMLNPRFKGITDGVTVIANGVVNKKQGCAVYKELGEKLIGGWAAVYIEGFEKPVTVEVSLEEYDQHRALWKTKPATMINKVAKSQALRKAFPEEFTGLYEPSEMGLDQPENTNVPAYLEYMEEPPDAVLEAETGFIPTSEVEVTYEAPEDPIKEAWHALGDLKAEAISLGISEDGIKGWAEAKFVNDDGTPKPMNTYSEYEIRSFSEHIQQLINDKQELMSGQLDVAI